MAQAITAPLHGDFIFGPGCVIPLADQTATTASQQFVGTGGRNISVQWITAMIYFKTFVVGTGTVYPIFSLEAADNTGFTTNPRRLGSFQPTLTEAIAAIPGTNFPHSFVIEGFCPDGGKNFVRIKVLTNGTSTLVYDAIIGGA